jgi:hypothetical protein
MSSLMTESVIDHAGPVSDHAKLRRAVMPARRFPPPWTVEGLDACFVVTDSARRHAAARRQSLIALVVVVVLLARELHSNQKVEDCVLSGRTNCVPIDTHSSSY